MTEFIVRRKRRKLLQWALAYVAFALIQVLDAVADSYDWPRVVMHFGKTGSTDFRHASDATATCIASPGSMTSTH